LKIPEDTREKIRNRYVSAGMKSCENNLSNITEVMKVSESQGF